MIGGITCDIKRSGTTIIEMIAALFVFAICANSFYAVTGGLIRLQKTFETERNALIVVGNALERIASAKSRNMDAISGILADELRRSGLNAMARAAVLDTHDGRSIILRVQDNKCRTLAETRISK